MHETAILAALDHPHIIRLHGRAGGGAVASPSLLSDGYFILLDRLTGTCSSCAQGMKRDLLPRELSLGFELDLGILKSGDVGRVYLLKG